MGSIFRPKKCADYNGSDSEYKYCVYGIDMYVRQGTKDALFITLELHTRVDDACR
jgi:hypothetical protein